jgi:hypothetical protein
MVNAPTPSRVMGTLMTPLKSASCRASDIVSDQTGVDVFSPKTEVVIDNLEASGA